MSRREADREDAALRVLRDLIAQTRSLQGIGVGAHHAARGGLVPVVGHDAVRLRPCTGGERGQAGRRERAGRHAAIGKIAALIHQAAEAVLSEGGKVTFQIVGSELFQRDENNQLGSGPGSPQARRSDERTQTGSARKGPSGNAH